MRKVAARLFTGTAFLVAISGCGGGGSGPFNRYALPTSTPSGGSTASSADTVSSVVTDGSVLAFPAVNGSSGSIGLPSSGVPSGEVLTITNNPSVPSGVSATTTKPAGFSGGLVQPYTTFTVSSAATLSQTPSLMVTLPSTNGGTYMAEIYDITNPNSPVFVSSTTGTVSGSMVTFPLANANPPITLLPGHTYVYSVYNSMSAGPTATPTATPNPDSTTAPVSNGSVVNFPTVNGISGSIGLPNSGVPSGEMLTITNNPSAPGGASPTTTTPPGFSGGLVAPYTTFSVSEAATLSQSPSLMVTLPSTPAGGTYMAEIYDITNPNSPIFVSTTTGTVSGMMLTFPFENLNPPITLQPGHTYVYSVYNSMSSGPTSAPSSGASSSPSTSPSSGASMSPTTAPSGAPTTAPSGTPTTAPSGTPTTAPSGTPTTAPSGTPTTAPSGTPTTAPSGTPTTAPSGTPTTAPSGTPTTAPSGTPTTAPTPSLSASPNTVSIKTNSTKTVVISDPTYSGTYYTNSSCTLLQASINPLTSTSGQFTITSGGTTGTCSFTFYENSLGGSPAITVPVTIGN